MQQKAHKHFPRDADIFEKRCCEAFLTTAITKGIPEGLTNSSATYDSWSLMPCVCGLVLGKLCTEVFIRARGGKQLPAVSGTWT